MSWEVGGHPARVFLSRASQPLGLQSLWAPCPPGHEQLAPRVWETGWARARPVGADLGSPKLVDTSVGSRKGLQHGMHPAVSTTLGDGRPLGTLVQASLVTTVHQGPSRGRLPDATIPDSTVQRDMRSLPTLPPESDSVLAPPPAHGAVILAYLTTPTPVPAPPHVPGLPGRFWPRLKTQGPPLHPDPASTS